MLPQTPHRSPRQPFGGNDNNQLLKLHHNDQNNLARNPLDKIPIAAVMIRYRIADRRAYRISGPTQVVGLPRN